jgi:hypothetical protein
MELHFDLQALNQVLNPVTHSFILRWLDATPL